MTVNKYSHNKYCCHRLINQPHTYNKTKSNKNTNVIAPLNIGVSPLYQYHQTLGDFSVDETLVSDQEELFVATEAGNKVEAIPFFTSSASTVLIRGGKVVNAEEEVEADVLVVEGVITRVEQGIQAPEGAMIVEAGYANNYYF